MISKLSSLTLRILAKVIAPSNLRNFSHSHFSPSTSNIKILSSKKLIKKMEEDEVEVEDTGSSPITSTSIVGLPTRSGNGSTIAIIQLTSTEDKEENLRVAEGFVRAAGENDAKMVFLPEAFDFIGTSVAETIALSETIDGPLITKFRALAVEYSMWISLGGFHERTNEMKPDRTPWLKNVHLIINPMGVITSQYSKMHLFDAKVGELSLNESSYIKGGEDLVLSGITPVGRIGLGVCYDVRFPEFAMAYRSLGAHVLTFPSAFTSHTGKAHWKSLMKTRAIENQCFVISAAQVGRHNNERTSHGNSIVVDPWGTILAEADEETPLIMFTDIDLEEMDKIRDEMPVQSHKIPGIYSILRNYESLAQINTVDDLPIIVNVKSPILGPGEFLVPTLVSGDTSFLFGPIVSKYDYVFLENRNARAFTNRKCVVPGHVLVSTKRVAKRLADLTSDEVSDLFLLAQKVEQIMESVQGVTSSTITVQDGADAGQTVAHVHCHVVPRRPNDFSENNDIYHELATHDKGPEVQWRPYEEMKEECDEIRLHIYDNFFDILSPQSRFRPLPYIPSDAF